MASQWYCFTDDEEGPFSFQELAHRLASGVLRPSDLVRRQESNNWQRADAVFGLMRAAHELSVLKSSPSRKESRGLLVRAARKLCQQLCPAFPPEQIIAGTSLMLVLASVFQMLWFWWQGPVRFPPPPAQKTIVLGPDRLEQLRPLAPAVPTLSRLEPGVPTLVPGFEQVDWLKSPALSADLLTIVYIGYAGTNQLDDLMIAERSNINEPFRGHRPLDAVNSSEREAHPALSPDGKELIFTRLGTPATLWISRREHRGVPFRAATQFVLQHDPDQHQHHDAVHYLDSQTLCIALSDTAFTIRQQWIARRSGRGGYQRENLVPVGNPWPRYFLTAGGKRAFLPTPEGLQVTAWSRRTGLFEDPELLFGSEVVGPDLTTNDDTLWVSPKEDVIFFCGPGPQPEAGKSRRLWMIRL